MAFQIEYENKDEIIIYPKGELDVLQHQNLKKKFLIFITRTKKTS